MAYTKVPPTVTNVPSATNVPTVVTKVPSATNYPAAASGGNTTNVIGVGASAATAIAINDANNKIQVGA